MVGLDPKGGQTFLHDDADSAAAPPQTHDKGGPKPGIENLPAETEAVEHVLLLGDEQLVAGAQRVALVMAPV